MAENWTIDSDSSRTHCEEDFGAGTGCGTFFADCCEQNPKLNAYLTLSEERAYAQADRVDALVADGQTVAGAGRRAGCDQGCNQHARRAYDLRVEDSRKLCAALRRDGGRAAESGRRGNSGQNQLRRVCDGQLERKFRVWPGAKSGGDWIAFPGGSSGGSAAAVAAGLAVASLGTDTGGSIRQPGAFCGIPAMMGSYGRVSRYGLIAFASSLDRIGPFATQREDVAQVLQVIAGRDSNDSTSTTAPVPDYAAEISKPVQRHAHRHSERIFRRGNGRPESARKSKPASRF